MVRGTVIAAAAVTALVACSGPPGMPPRSGSPLGSAPPTQGGSGSKSKPLLVFAEPAALDGAGDLWLYDVAADRVKRVTHDGRQIWQDAPRFRTPSRITYVVDQERPARILEHDLRSGSVKMLARIDADEVFGMHWAPDGRRAAIGTVDWNARNGMGVGILTSDGSVRIIARYRTGCGREPIDSDEFEVMFSPDGNKLLYTNVCTDPPSVRVLNLDGLDLVDPIRGTQGRWLGGGTAIMVRLLDERASIDRWVKIDLATGSREDLGLQTGSNAPALSPDGRLVAYERGRATWVLDLVTKERKPVAADHLAPIWIERRVIVATQVRDCPPPDPDGVGWCDGERITSWIPTGATTAFDLRARSERMLTLSSTLPKIGRGVPNVDLVYQ